MGRKRIKYGLIPNMQRVCYDCERRNAECHVGCEDYAHEIILSTIIDGVKKREYRKYKQADAYARNRAEVKKKATLPKNRYKRGVR
jgi:hypothetical protein